MKMAILKETGMPIKGKRGQYAEDKTFGGSIHHTGRKREEYDFVDVDISRMRGVKDYVVVSKSHLESLEDDSHTLSCLEAFGVDNWQGYGDAISMKREEDELGLN